MTNETRKYVIAQAKSVSPERKFAFYRWMLSIYKSK